MNDQLDNSSPSVAALTAEAASPPASTTSPPDRLWNRNFTLLWQGQWVSQIGSQFGHIAIMLWLVQATGSATLMGTIMMVGAIPGVILGPVGGVLADRHSRKAIIVWSDVIKGLLVLALAAMLFFIPDQTSIIVVGMFVLAVSGGVVEAFFRPAISAAVPDLVPGEKLSAANSLTQASAEIAKFLGQGIAGKLFVMFGAGWLLAIDGITYLGSAVSETFITIPRSRQAEAQDDSPDDAHPWKRAFRAFVKDLRIGFNFIVGNRGMVWLFVTASLLNFILTPFMVLLPLFVQDFLQAGPEWFGYLIAGFGVGSLLGFAVAGGLPMGPKLRAFVMIGSLSLAGLFFVIFALTTSVWVAMAITVVNGALFGFFNIGVMTVLQLATPSEIRGRVFSLLGTLGMGLMPIGMGLSGIVADLIDQDIAAILVVSGLGLFAISACAAISPTFRRFLASDEPAAKNEASESA